MTQDQINGLARIAGDAQRKANAAAATIIPMNPASRIFPDADPLEIAQADALCHFRANATVLVHRVFIGEVYETSWGQFVGDGCDDAETLADICHQLIAGGVAEVGGGAASELRIEMRHPGWDV